MINFIEKQKSIDSEVLYHLKMIAADNVQEYFQKPSEDIHLMIEKIVKEIQ